MAEFYGDVECYKMENGVLVPTLDTHYATYGIFIRKGQKKPFVFDLEKEPESMYNFMIDMINREGKRGHQATFWFFNSNYDMTAVLRGNYHNENVKYINHKPLIIEIKTEKGTGTIRDLTNLFPKMKLKRLGEIIGLPKLNMPKAIFSKEQLHDYCLRDCEIQEVAMKKLKEAVNEMYGYKPKKLVSIYKLGYDLLQFSVSKETYKKTYADGSVKEVGKAGYWWWNGKIFPTQYPEMIGVSSRGGRIEAYQWSTPNNRKRFNDVWKLDLNSAYPFLCSHKDFPDIRTEKEEKNVDIDTLDIPTVNEYFSRLGISEVTIKAPDIYVPYLPIRDKQKTLYPRKAILHGFWTNYEIQQAVTKYGYKLLQIHKTVTYKKMPFNMFENYFKKLYSIKVGEEGTLKDIAKIIMNSSTGRFAMKIANRINETIRVEKLGKYQAEGFGLIDDDIIDLENGYIIVYKTVEKKHYSNKANPSVYTHITAYMRDYLYQHMIKLPEDDLLYVTTDAIMFKNKKNLELFDIGTNMGQWKVEERGNVAEVWNEQYYEIDGRVKMSGVTDAIKHIDALREGKQFTTKRLITINQGSKKGNFEEIGSFTDVPMNLTYRPKRSLDYKDYIEEKLPSKMIQPWGRK
jgi:hypothetical protein